jgi:hypothetical protein
MEEKQVPMVPGPSSSNVRKPKAPGFHRGHLKAPNSGRKKHSSQYVRQLCEELDICPIEFMLRIVRDGYVLKTVLRDGKKNKVEVEATLDQQLDCAKTLAQYLVPKLQSTALTNADHDGPVESVTAHVDLLALLDSPEAVQAAQTLGLSLASADARPAALETSEPLDTTATDATRDFSADLDDKDSAGHWRQR